MKRLNLTLWMLMMVLSINAAPRSLSQARAIALDKATTLGVEITSTSKGIKRSMINTNRQTQITDESFYVFSGTQGKGYIIIAGDDRMPDIVGYSTNGTFDTNNLPEGFKAFLQLYDETLVAVNNNNSQVVSDIKKAKANKEKHAVIEPLLGDISWAQDKPFNAMCPPYSDTENCLTGCVATAMSQIMRYHKYPQTIQTDIPVYATTFGDEKLDRIPEGTPLDWDNMLPQYEEGAYNEQQQKAVATLMLSAGMAIKARYGHALTEAHTQAQAFVKYFGYDPDLIAMPYRNGYNVTEWKAIIDHELDNKRPILYAASNAKREGHAFVCDGCDENGLYHINWGWATTNGYYDISILNPGTSDEALYDYTQEVLMVVGIAPDNNVEDKPLVTDHGLTFKKSELYFKTNEDNTTHFDGITITDIGNRSLEEFKGYIGAAYIDANGEYHIISGEDNYFKMDGAPNEYTYYYQYYYYVSIEKELQPGTYTIVPVSRKDGGNWEIIRGPYNRHKIKVTETEVTEITQDLTVEFEAIDELYAEVENTFSITFTNYGNEDIDQKLIISNSSEKTSIGWHIAEIMISLKPGESMTRKFSYEPYTPKTEYLVVGNEFNKVIAFKKIKISEYKEPRLTIISAKFNNVDKTMKHEEGFHVSSEIDWDFFYFDCIDDVKTTYICEIQNQGGPCTTHLYLQSGSVGYRNGWIDTNSEEIKKLADEKFGAGETKKFVFDIDLSLKYECLFSISISTNTFGRPYNPISIYTALEPLEFTNHNGRITLKAKRNYGECIAYCTGNTNSIESTTTNGGIEIKNANGAITMKSNNARHLNIYHISGSKVCDLNLSDNIPTTISLPSGIYIVNGRKIVVGTK